MKETDIKRMGLKERFRNGVDPTIETESRLGVHLPNTRSIVEALHGDLAEGPPHGIKWWEPSVDSQRARRILISDYLYACTANIGHHLLAARLHFLEVVDWTEREEQSRNERTRIEVPGCRASHPRDVYENLYTLHIDGHQKGIILSLASALDCLAAGIVGICAVPVQIKTAKFGSIRRDLSENRKKHVTPASTALHSTVWEELRETIKQCGRAGWLDWLVQYRNMLVHRGLRQEPHDLAVGSELLTPDLRPTKVLDTPHLPSQPSLSEVEAYLASNPLGAIGLSEDARNTLEGLTESVMKLTEHVAELLMKVWKDRRNAPQAIPQPFEKQWKEPVGSEWSKFRGYAPGSKPVDATGMIHNPTFHERLVAAALDDQQRSIWKKKGMKRFIPERPKEQT